MIITFCQSVRFKGMEWIAWYFSPSTHSCTPGIIFMTFLKKNTPLFNSCSFLKKVWKLNWQAFFLFLKSSPMFQREFLQFGQTLDIKYLMQKRSNSEILGNGLVPYSNYDLPELPLNKELCSFKAITRNLKKKQTKRKNNATHKAYILMPVNFKRAHFPLESGFCHGHYVSSWLSYMWFTLQKEQPLLKQFSWT